MIRLPWLLLRSCAPVLLAWPLAGPSALGQAQVLASTKRPEPEDESVISACKTDLRLSGSVFDAEYPERSLAVFQVPSTHASAVYRLGSRVGAYELVAVVPRGVVLRSSDGECWLRLVGEPSGQSPVAAAPPPQPQTERKKRKSARAKGKKPAVEVIGSGTR